MRASWPRGGATCLNRSLQGPCLAWHSQRASKRLLRLYGHSSACLLFFPCRTQAGLFSWASAIAWRGA